MSRMHRAAAVGLRALGRRLRARAGPDYPEPTRFATGRASCSPPGPRVLDLAAGTGKLTRPLLAARAAR